MGLLGSSGTSGGGPPSMSLWARLVDGPALGQAPGPFLPKAE